MTTNQTFLTNGGQPEQIRPATTEASPDESAALDAESKSRNGSRRKVRRRSVFQFPAYGFQMALDIARQVEENGGGTLTEETLAVNLGLSKNSSGFRLKCLAARHFNLLTKQGASVSTTSIAKAILKPTSDEDARRGYQQSFLSIPLFQAVSERYRGQRLPDSQTLRNVLEREFQVEPKRVQQAERMLLDSARRTQVLQHLDDGSYLNISEAMQTGDDDSGASIDYDFPWTGGSFASTEVGDRSSHNIPTTNSVNTFSFSLDEIGKLSDEDFISVWHAVGILVKARGARSRSSMESNGDPSLW